MVVFLPTRYYILSIKLNILGPMRQKLFPYSLSLIFILAILIIATIPNQGDFLILSTAYLSAFAAYLYLCFSTKTQLSLRFMIGLAVVLKLSLIFTFPRLSDDIYRFIWDGNLLQAGINPYSSLPTDILSQNIAGNDRALFEQLNSPNYYTIYPPITQLVFYFSSFFSDSYYAGNVIMKGFNTLAEIGAIYYIAKLLGILNIDKRRVLIYALNPLVLVELGANLHMESIMILFFFMGIYYLYKQELLKMSLAVATGIGSKLMPMMFLPLIWKYTGNSKRVFFSIASACILLFLPLFFGLEWLKFGQSLDLYFGKFEFNGGIYILLREIGELLSGYNLIRFIGPGMALLTVFYIIKLFLRQQKNKLSQLLHFCFYSICCYYFLSTTVHPWYLSLPLALSCFTGYRFVVLWSGLIILSYINYSYEPYQENLWVGFIEYSLVFGYLIHEIKKGDQES